MRLKINDTSNRDYFERKYITKKNLFMLFNCYCYICFLIHKNECLIFIVCTLYSNNPFLHFHVIETKCETILKVIE